MGISDGKIVVKNKDRVKAAEDLLVEMVDEDAEILTIFRGEDATESDVAALSEFIETKYPDVEIEVHNGQQPLYAFIFAIE